MESCKYLYMASLMLIWNELPLTESSGKFLCKAKTYNIYSTKNHLQPIKSDLGKWRQTGQQKHGTENWCTDRYHCNAVRSSSLGN